MGKIADALRSSCCGTTCDKEILVNKVNQLELQNAELQKEVDEYNRLRGNKEAFARKCFNAGMLAVEMRDSSLYCDIKHWLNFKATEL